MPDWLFVDGSSLIFRAFYGVPTSIRSPDGKPVNAVRGFMDRLARLISDRRPGRLAVASDEDWRPRWRVDLIPSYKAHRVAEPVPPQLEPQMPIIHEVLDAVGIDFVGVPDYEAEDVIASWVAQVPAGERVDIASGDRDLFALVRGDEVRVLYPEKNGLAEIDEAEVERRYGIPGRSYGDYAVLRGDPSDGLPGVPGVGEKTAAQLVRRFKDLDGIIASGKLGEAANAYIERARRVGVPVNIAPVPKPAGTRPATPRDPQALAKLTETYGIGSSIDRLVRALAVPPTPVRTR